MKSQLTILFSSVVAFTLTGCVLDENGNIPGTYGSTAVGPSSNLPRGFSQPLSVSTALGSVTIREGARVLSSISTASPNVEQTRWRSEQEQIVVKSRGNHGPATVQLFNSRTGREEGRVKAFEIKNGQPAWAAGMGE
jgi:hypothetical protein